MKVFNYNDSPVTAEEWGKTYDDEGNETGVVLVTPASEEVIGLEITTKQVKTKQDIERIIDKGKSQQVIDSFIGLYLDSIDPSNAIEEEWYKQHLLVESADADAPREVISFVDEEGKEHTQELPTDYDLALEARNELEISADWLKGYRGLESEERPVYTPDIEAWKNNNIDPRQMRFQEYINLSPEKKFEHTVGDILDALIKWTQGDTIELDALIPKIVGIKTKHPKRTKK